MAQIFQALKCYQCHTFQVQIKKKSKRWACKLCGEKQSFMQIFGEGSSKDCRIHVQRLNSLRGTQEEVKRMKFEDTNEAEDVPIANSLECVREEDESGPVSGTSKPTSKWATYLENDAEDVDSNSEEEAQLPEIPQSKAIANPESKWACYVDEDLPSAIPGRVKHEKEQRNSYSSCQKVKGQSTSACIGQVKEAVNCEGDAPIDKLPQRCMSPSTNDDGREPCHKRVCNELSHLDPPRKRMNVTAEEAECSVQNFLTANKHKLVQDNVRVFNSTENEELDDVLKL